MIRQDYFYLYTFVFYLIYHGLLFCTIEPKIFFSSSDSLIRLSTLLLSTSFTVLLMIRSQ